MDAAGLSAGQAGYNAATENGIPASPQTSTAPADPNNPGYLTDGSPDPAYSTAGGGSAGGLDASGIVTDPNGNVLYDPGAPDADIVPMPARGGTLASSDAMGVVSGPIPSDGIPCGAIPNGAIGSANIFYGDGRGYFYGSSETGVDTSWRGTHNDLGWYHKQNTGDIIADRYNWNDLGDNEKMSIDQANAMSIRDGFGPIVGNNGNNAVEGISRSPMRSMLRAARRCSGRARTSRGHDGGD